MSLGKRLKLIVMVIPLLVVACSRPLGTESETTSMVLNLSLDTEVSTLDSQAAIDSASFEVIGCLMEGLYRRDQSGQAIPGIAESTEVLDNGMTYLIHLRDAKWSDGTPVMAEDFVYGWQRAVNPENGNENSFMFTIAGIKNATMIIEGNHSIEELGIEAIDDKTLQIKLERPVTYFESLMAFPTFFPVKRSFYEQYGSQYGTSPQAMLANGPFVLTGYEPAATTISLHKNEHYWDHQSVKLDGIKFQVMKDSQQVLMAYQKGELDMAVISGEQVEQFEMSNEYHTFSIGSLWYLSPNQEVEGLDNLHLRKALALSYDKQAITSMIMRDGSVPADFVVPSGLAADSGGRDFRADGALYLQTDKAMAEYYWGLAKKELGLEEITLELLIEDTEFSIMIAQFLQAEIQNSLSGVTISLDQVPKKNRLTRMADGEYQLAMSRWGADYADPAAFLGMWTTNSPYNYGQWQNSEYDHLLDLATTGEWAGNTKKRWQALKRAEEIIMDEAAIFPICQKSYAVLIKPEISGIEFHLVGINKIYRNTEKK